MDDSFEGFKCIEFPSEKEYDIVYVLCFAQVGNKKTPFYVGKSTQHTARLGYYISAKFTASTDFRVGEAIKYLRHGLGLSVWVYYKQSQNVARDEQQMIDELGKSYRLLNNAKALGYEYKTADEAVVRARIHAFIKQMVG